MKIKVIIELILILIILTQSLILSTPLLYDISQELKYINSLIKDSIAKADRESLLISQRAISKLEKVVDGLKNSKEKSYLYLALGYLSIKLAKEVVLNQIDLSIKGGKEFKHPVKSVEHHFNSALNTAKNLDKKDFGDVHFFIGLGYDFLRGKLSSISDAYASELYLKSKAHLEKSIQLGSVYGNVENVISKINNISYKTQKTIYEENKLEELFYLFIPKLKRVKGVIDVTDSDKIEGQIIEEERFVSYKWRFSIGKRNGWKFSTTDTKAGIRVSLLKEVEEGPKPNVNISAIDLPSNKISESLEDIANGNLKNLEQIGYVVEKKNKINFKGYEAIEAILSLSTVETQIQENTVRNFPETKQYLLILVNNNIQYIINAVSISNVFDKYLEEFKQIIDTFSIL